MINAGNLSNYTEGGSATLTATKTSKGTVSQEITLTDDPQEIKGMEGIEGGTDD